MKKPFLILLVFYANLLFAQHTVRLKPHYDGNDVQVEALNKSSSAWYSAIPFAHIDDTNLYRNTNTELLACSWTFNSCPGWVRVLICFAGIKDTSVIPRGAKIISATLKLFSTDTTYTYNWGNSWYSGTPRSTNETYVYELADTFNKYTVTWNTQPDIRHDDSAYIDVSHHRWHDSTNVVDVTNMVTDMFLSVNTGFGIRLKNEPTYYRERMWASCFYPDSSLHPELIIIYSPILDSVKCETAWFWANADTSISSYKWYFGDGASDTGRAVSHHYGSFGKYGVTLIKTFHSGITDTAIDTLKLVNKIDAIKYDFSDLKLSCKLLKFTASYVSGDTAISYKWHSSDGAVDSVNPFYHFYSSAGTYTAGLIVQDRYGCVDTIEKTVVLDTANYNYSIVDSLVNCKSLKLNAVLISGDTAYAIKWFFGDGSTDSLNPEIHTYASAGAYTIKLVISNRSKCVIDTFSRSENIRSAHFNYGLEDSIFNCNTVKFNAIWVSGDTSQSFLWHFGDGSSDTLNPTSHTYAAFGTFNVKLLLTNDTKCIDSVSKLILLKKANFNYNIHVTVLNCVSATFDAIYINGDTTISYLWDLGDGSYGSSNPITHVYKNTGTYSVTLKVINSAGCTDSFLTNLDIHTSASIKAYSDTAICIGASVQLNATGTLNYNWSPSENINNNNIADPIATPVNSTVYTVTGVDSNGCTSEDSVTIVVNPLPSIVASTSDNYRNCKTHDIQLMATGALNYLWEPGKYCSNARLSAPVVNFPDTAVLFTVTGIDSNGCMDSASIKVHKHFDAIVSLPGAFSPNGDGANDILYVRGANISSLNFSIYNRWGQIIFETNDMNKGWDGTFNGFPQPIETYGYVIRVSSIDGCEILQKGNFILLR